MGGVVALANALRWLPSQAEPGYLNDVFPEHPADLPNIRGGRRPPYCCLLERQRFPEMSSPGAAASFWAAKTAKPSELHPLATRQPIWRPK